VALQRSTHVAMARGRPRTTPRAPLGEWLSAKLRERGLKQEPFAKSIGVTVQAFNNYSLGAVPKTPQVLAMRRELKLSQTEKAELDDVLERQSKFREAPREQSLSGPEKTVRTTERRVEYNDVYPTRPAFLALMRAEGFDEEFIEAVRNYHESSDVDPGSPNGRGWTDVVRELQTRRLELRKLKEASVSTEAPDVSDAALEAASKRKSRGKG
jgi:transcriptional regulator with XRE-family HTH domain